MSYKLVSPLPIIEGGTGVKLTTPYAVICGGTTNTGPLQFIASVGTSGQVLTSNGPGALPTFQTGVVGEVDTLTGNSGGAIAPLTGNINVVGDGTGITIVGSGHTLTASLVSGSAFVETLTGSTSGGAISPSLGNINITAGTGITVVGTANTLTISATGGSGLTSITGDTGGAQTGPAISLVANATAGSSVSFSGSSNTISLNVTDANRNTLIGKSSGIAGITGQFNIGLGAFTGASLTSGALNTMIGDSAGILINSGARNTLVGNGAGFNYTVETDNIILGSSIFGMVGESNVLRIGASTGSGGGQLNQSFIAGIYGITPATADGVPVFIGSDGQLGTVGSGGTTLISTITGDTGGAQTGPAITFAGGTTGLSFGGATNTITTTFAGITANGGTVSLATDATTSTINIGTGAGAKTSTFGSTNSSSTTTLHSGSGGINLTNTNNPITIISGTGTVAISNDATTNTVNIGTGGGVKTVTVGSTNSSSSLALQSGTGNFNLTSASGTTITALAAGEVTMPRQPAFEVRLATSLTNLTGDGTFYQIVFDTLVYDNGSNVNLTGPPTFFTAPVTGIYNFSCCAFFTGLGASFTDARINLLTTTAGQIVMIRQNPANTNTSGLLVVNGNVYTKMNAGDTAYVQIYVGGSTKTIGLLGDATAFTTYFCGSLIS